MSTPTPNSPIPLPKTTLPLLSLGATSPHQLSRLLSDTIKPLLQKHAIIIANNQHQLSLQISHLNTLVQSLYLALSLESQRTRVVNQSLPTVPDNRAFEVKNRVDKYNQLFGVYVDQRGNPIKPPSNKEIGITTTNPIQQQHLPRIIPQVQPRTQPFHEYNPTFFELVPFKMPERQIEVVIDQPTHDMSLLEQNNQQYQQFRFQDGQNEQNIAPLSVSIEDFENDTDLPSIPSQQQQSQQIITVTTTTSPTALTDTDLINTLPTIPELIKSLNILAQAVEEVGINILALNQIIRPQPP